MNQARPPRGRMSFGRRARVGHVGVIGAPLQGDQRALLRAMRLQRRLRLGHEGLGAAHTGHAAQVILFGFILSIKQFLIK